MVAHRLLSSAMRSSDDSNWSVHSLVLPCYVTTAFWCPSSMVFGSVSVRRHGRTMIACNAWQWDGSILVNRECWRDWFHYELIWRMHHINWTKWYCSHMTHRLHVKFLTTYRPQIVCQWLQTFQIMATFGFEKQVLTIDSSSVTCVTS